MNIHRLTALFKYSTLILPYTLLVTIILVFMNTLSVVLTAKPLPQGKILETLVTQSIRVFSHLLPTLGLAGGFVLYRIFHRGEDVFWWNLGLPLSLRLVASFCIIGAVSLGIQGLIWLF